MSSGSPMRALYVQFAAVAKALGNEHRLELLELVAQGERSVEALAEGSRLSIANASQHLQHLRRAGLVTAPAGQVRSLQPSGRRRFDRSLGDTQSRPAKCRRR